MYLGCLTSDGKREGLGIFIYANGRVYEGEWKNDRMNGRGFEIFSGGSTYIGIFLENKAHG